jgi:protein tyrosine/serine phosphatase
VIFLSAGHNPFGRDRRSENDREEAFVTLPANSLTHVARWALGAVVAVVVTAIPVGFYRWNYADQKRLREIVPEKFYRSGHLTAAGFTEAVDRLKIRTIINLQDEYPDPDVAVSFFDRRVMKEKALCDHLGVRYVHIAPDLHPPETAAKKQPRAIAEFLQIMDDPTTYPALIHCRAGLHRTGVLTAVYRMEYQGWSTDDALRELKENGFGNTTCNSANEYVAQYVLAYRPRERSTLSSTSRPDGWPGFEIRSPTTKQ